MIRKTVFWLHLIAGVVCGLVIAMMSLTGVLLTYEHQLAAWSDREYSSEPPPNASRASIEVFVNAAAASDVVAREIEFSSDPAAPVLISAGRGGKSLYVDPYSGDVLGPPANGFRNTMSVLTRWHRWFNAEGESRAAARLVTGVSNLAFLFLILSGIYLWLPKVFRWPLFRARIWFAGKYRNSKVRDFHWHHIFAFWTVVPLIIVVGSAVVISFSWANSLMFKAVGEDPPNRRGPEPLVVFASKSVEGARRLELDELLTVAKKVRSDWRAISFELPDDSDSSLQFEIDRGTGRQPQFRHIVAIDRITGKVVGSRIFSDGTTGRKLRTWVRFAHTGEYYGFVGQTLAGLASLASLFMVYTGLTLAWRRLICPMFTSA